MAGLGIDGGDDAVDRHPPGDAEHPAVALLDILAGHQGQQRGCVSRRGVEYLSVEHGQGAERVTHEGVDHRLSGLGVVPVTRRHARPGVVVVTTKGAPHLGGQLAVIAVERRQHLADGRAQLGDGVSGGHRVVDGRRVQYPHSASHEPGLFRHHLGVLEQPPGPG